MLAERTGLAYLRQAAESLASDSLRVPSRAPRRGSTLATIDKEKAPASGAFSLMLAERTELAYLRQAAESLASDSLRVPSRAPRRGSTLATIDKEKAPASGAFSLMLAERTGLEPATPDVTGRYSNQLNYHSVLL
jgi:hypothetical protein